MSWPGRDSYVDTGLSRSEGRDISVSARRQGTVSPSNFKQFFFVFFHFRQISILSIKLLTVLKFVCLFGVLSSPREIFTH